MVSLNWSQGNMIGQPLVFLHKYKAFNRRVSPEACGWLKFVESPIDLDWLGITRYHLQQTATIVYNIYGKSTDDFPMKNSDCPFIYVSYVTGPVMIQLI